MQSQITTPSSMGVIEHRLNVLDGLIDLVTYGETIFTDRENNVATAMSELNGLLYLIVQEMKAIRSEMKP